MEDRFDASIGDGPDLVTTAARWAIGSGKIYANSSNNFTSCDRVCAVIKGKPAQLELAMPADASKRTWGGRRAGAGRPRKALAAGEKARAGHGRRPWIDPQTVAHVTLRTVAAVGGLRRMDAYRALNAGLRAVWTRGAFRVLHFSLQGNHVHLVAEADHKEQLSNGVRAFCISMAKHLNAKAKRKGRVFADRYHARALRTPTEVRNALRYVLNNWRHHQESRAPWPVDPYSSAANFSGWRELGDRWELYPLRPGFERARTAAAQSWLAQEGWMRAGTISVWSVPG